MEIYLTFIRCLLAFSATPARLESARYTVRAVTSLSTWLTLQALSRGVETRREPEEGRQGRPLRRYAPTRQRTASNGLKDQPPVPARGPQGNRSTPPSSPPCFPSPYITTSAPSQSAFTSNISPLTVRDDRKGALPSAPLLSPPLPRARR